MQGQIIEAGKPVSAIVMCDTHRCPSDPSDFDDVPLAIGDYIYDEAPDYAIHLGDLGEFRGVNAHKGGALMGGDGSDEDHCVVEDAAVWHTGLRLFKSRYKDEARRHTRAGHKERIPDIQWVFCEGNHEEMLRSRLPKKHKALRSVPKLKELNLPQFAEDEDWSFIPFLSPLTINGLTFQHYFQGLNPKQALAIQTVQSRNGASSAFGHTHQFDVRHWKDAHGRRRTIINAGCTKHPSRLRRHEDSGIVHIKNLFDGQFTYEWVPMETLLRRYRENTRGARR